MLLIYSAEVHMELSGDLLLLLLLLFCIAMISYMSEYAKLIVKIPS